MTTSLIISTYNWPEALELVLLSCIQQSVLPNEIVIADDGSDKRTKNLIQKFDNLGVKILHAWHEDNGFRKSLILNKALAMCTSDYIIEVDGDIILHKHFIQDHIKGAQKGYFVQGSRAMMGPRLTEKTLSTKRINLHAFMPGFTTRFNAIRFTPLSFLFKTDPRNSRNVKGCNLAFWKSDYVYVNGYFSGFEGWGWEDYEFAERMINSGVKKKKLKWAAVGYHLYHKLSSRANFIPNELIYRETVQNKLYQRSPGLREIANF